MASMHALPDEVREATPSLPPSLPLSLTHSLAHSLQVLDAPPPEVTAFGENEHASLPPRPGEREQARGDEVATWLSAKSARRVSE